MLPLPLTVVFLNSGSGDIYIQSDVDRVMILQTFVTTDQQLRALRVKMSTG
jgi:hypothetical protein